MHRSAEATDIKKLVAALVLLQICLVINSSVRSGQMRHVLDVFQGRKDAPLHRHLQSRFNHTSYKDLDVTFTHQSRFSKRSKQAISEVAKSFGFVNIQFLSDAYVEMTLSWICNVRQLEGDILGATVFVATDEQAFQRLKAFDAALHLIPQGYDPNASNTELSYGRESYFAMMLWRSELLLDLLESSISIMLTESDAVWLRNPFSVIGLPHVEMDVIVMDDQMEERQRRKLPNGGFLFLRSCNRTRQAWRQVVALQKEEMQVFKRRRLGLKGGNYFRNEQVFEKKVFESLARTGQLSLQWLPIESFASGKFYAQLESNSSAFRLKMPCVILNNFIKGTDEKVLRAKRFNHWYLSQDMKCIRDIASPWG